MVIDTANCLVDAIRDLGVFAPDQLDHLRLLSERGIGTRDLARLTMQRGWLTAFQANYLLQGRGAALLVGPYVLLSRLGAGGMGEVFKARHRRLQRVAAIKLVSREKLGASGVQRFLREAEAAAQLSHPNIVAVYDAAAEGDRHYLAMEFIDGIDLARLVSQVGPLPVALASDFARQAALGLASAHDKGLVHRDIKPSNLLVAPRGGMGKLSDQVAIERLAGANVKILDMGLVRLQSDESDDTELALTKQGVVIGTLDYLAPEQARNAHRVDHRADLYGLGCTLYYLLTGQPPFPGGMPLDKLLRHQTDDPAPVSSVRADVPAELEASVMRLLAKRPEDRFQSADEAATALAGCNGKATPTKVVHVPPLPIALLTGSSGAVRIETDGLAETVEEPVSPSRRQRSPAPPVKRRWWWAAGLFAVLLLLVFLGLAWRRPAAPTGKAETHPRDDAVGVIQAPTVVGVREKDWPLPW